MIAGSGFLQNSEQGNTFWHRERGFQQRQQPVVVRFDCVNFFLFSVADKGLFSHQEYVGCAGNRADVLPVVGKLVGFDDAIVRHFIELLVQCVNFERTKKGNRDTKQR